MEEEDSDLEWENAEDLWEEWKDKVFDYDF